MKYFSTNKQSPFVDFKEATIQGQAPDKGLYFPETIPTVDKNLIVDIENISNEDIGFRVLKPYVGNTIPDENLFQIVSESISFPIPLVKISDYIYSLELFHGPTLAFKDVGARFMSRCLGFFLKDEKKNVTILVATSGDTGGAVANGFYNVDGVEVVILYPSGKVSAVQEQQLTSLGKNIHALEVQGNFDDCQQMVKQAFADKDINQHLFLSSANSINIARWLPQQMYYFFAYKQWLDKSAPPVISVPSGNFGNICAGILAMKSGLPVQHFIAACNKNDVVSIFLETQKFIPKKAEATISNAMDVGNPSNFVRILEIFKQQFLELKSCLSALSVSDAATVETIKSVYSQHQYLLDPHGAVGYFALQHYLTQHESQKGIFLETAHPVKFPSTVTQATGKTIELPDDLNQLMQAEKQSILIEPEYAILKDYLLKG